MNFRIFHKEMRTLNKNVKPVLYPLHFHMNFRISLPISTKRWEPWIKMSNFCVNVSSQTILEIKTHTFFFFFAVMPGKSSVFDMQKSIKSERKPRLRILKSLWLCISDTPQGCFIGRCSYHMGLHIVSLHLDFLTEARPLCCNIMCHLHSCISYLRASSISLNKNVF